MSETIKATTDMTCLRYVEMACKRIGIDAPIVGKHDLYQQQSKGIEGIGVKLQGWRFPVVINQETGELSYDNYNGTWGDEERLREFKRAYMVVKACDQIRKLGHRPLVKTVNGKTVVRMAINQNAR